MQPIKLSPLCDFQHWHDAQNQVHGGFHPRDIRQMISGFQWPGKVSPTFKSCKVFTWSQSDDIEVQLSYRRECWHIAIYRINADGSSEIITKDASF